MKLHSRNRKRKLDSFLGAPSLSGANPPYSMSFSDESSLASKRMKLNNFASASQMANEDDEIEIICAT